MNTDNLKQQFTNLMSELSGAEREIHDMDDKSKSLDFQILRLQEVENRIKDKNEALGKREHDCIKKEETLKQTEQSLLVKDGTINRKNNELTILATKLKERERLVMGLEDKSIELEKRKRELDALQSSLEDQQNIIRKEKMVLLERKEILELREKSIEARATRLSNAIK